MKNPYLPHVAVLQDIRDEGPGLKTFDMVFKDESVWDELKPGPGQFVELSIFGEGEAPFGVATGIQEAGLLRLSIQSVGRLTRMLHGMSPGDELGVRGPFGAGWPMEGGEGQAPRADRRRDRLAPDSERARLRDRREGPV